MSNVSQTLSVCLWLSCEHIDMSYISILAHWLER